MPDANYYDDEDEGLLTLSPEELRVYATLLMLLKCVAVSQPMS